MLQSGAGGVWGVDSKLKSELERRIFMSTVPFTYCIHTCQERINNPRKFISLNRRARKDFSANKMEATSNSLRSRFRSTEQRYSRLAGFRETPTDYCVWRAPMVEI